MSRAPAVSLPLFGHTVSDSNCVTAFDCRGGGTCCAMLAPWSLPYASMTRRPHCGGSGW